MNLGSQKSLKTFSEKKRVQCASGGGSGRFPLTRGQDGFSNYRKAFFPKVNEVTVGDHGESHVHGVGARVDFQLSPESSTCKVQRSGPHKVLKCERTGRKFKKRRGY